MTTLEALDLALAALREKCDMDRRAANINPDRPHLAKAVDPHTVNRYQRHMLAIALLGDLKKQEKERIAIADGPKGVAP